MCGEFGYVGPVCVRLPAAFECILYRLRCQSDQMSRWNKPIMDGGKGMMGEQKRPFRLGWVLSMAWRDTRWHRKKLLLYISSIVLGAAALVMVRSLAENLESAIDLEAKSLLGADLALSSNQAFPAPVRSFIDSVKAETAEQLSFSSMIYVPKNGSSRLVQVRAIAGRYPFYGVLETVPAAAAAAFRQSQAALVDDGLMIQYDLSVGDSVRIGAVNFRIAGRLVKIPGESLAMSAIGPRVYIPMDYLDETGLIQVGSRVSYKRYLKIDSLPEIARIVAVSKPLREKYFINFETVETRKEQIGNAIANLYRFLNLSGFMALILGCVGVASSITTYIRQKLDTVAILRCLGADARQIFLIFVTQALALGMIGTTIGAGVGIAALYATPALLGDFLPVSLEVRPSLTAVAQGMGIGLLMPLLFSLLPLLSIRNISPLTALRSAYQSDRANRIDPWTCIVFLLIVGSITLFAIVQTRRIGQGLLVSGGLCGVYLILYLASKVLIRSVHILTRKNSPYLWRQGLANLFRPNNQTTLLMVSLGLAAFLVMTIFTIQYSLLDMVRLAGSGDQPNLVIFDVQSDQKAEVLALMARYEFPVRQQVPVVTMRLSSVRGEPLENLMRSDGSTGTTVQGRQLRREYRATYRNELIETETLVAGVFTGKMDSSVGPIPVSLESSVAEDLQLKVGDKIGFDVQGIPFGAVVGSIRKVNWQRVQPNFFVVFPDGTLDSAPQFNVLVTRSNNTKMSAGFQRELVQKLPNVSVIDLQLILSAADAILEKVSLVFRFMALFSLLTGFIVLVGIVSNSRYQRIQESVLIKTLGGTRRQILKIMAIEYILLGLIGSFSGVLLSLFGSWLLVRFFFDLAFNLPVLAMISVITAVTAITLIVGTVTGSRIYARPPLEILRSEI